MINGQLRQFLSQAVSLDPTQQPSKRHQLIIKTPLKSQSNKKRLKQISNNFHSQLINMNCSVGSQIMNSPQIYYVQNATMSGFQNQLSISSINPIRLNTSLSMTNFTSSMAPIVPVIQQSSQNSILKMSTNMVKMQVPNKYYVYSIHPQNKVINTDIIQDKIQLNEFTMEKKVQSLNKSIQQSQKSIQSQIPNEKYFSLPQELQQQKESHLQEIRVNEIENLLKQNGSSQVIREDTQNSQVKEGKIQDESPMKQKMNTLLLKLEQYQTANNAKIDPMNRKTKNEKSKKNIIQRVRKLIIKRQKIIKINMRKLLKYWKNKKSEPKITNKKKRKVLENIIQSTTINISKEKMKKQAINNTASDQTLSCPVRSINSFNAIAQN